MSWAHVWQAWIQSGEVLCKGCTHIFLGEPDYVFVKPPHFPIPPSGEAVGFIYDYVAPNWGQNKKVWLVPWMILSPTAFNVELSVCSRSSRGSWERHQTEKWLTCRCLGLAPW
eukprot:scaffold1220_cov376-Prasinococcus_capsulatus_cf.AAC.8